MTKANEREEVIGKASETANSVLSDHTEAGLVGPVLKALKFAAEKHSRQRRKDSDASPYVNHLIDIAEILACVGGIADLTTLQGAILHDTIEDTQTTADELEKVFGPEVRRLIEEVTDDKRLPKLERKRLQIEQAPYLSTRAKLIKIADKISNVRDVTHSNGLSSVARNTWTGQNELCPAAAVAIRRLKIYLIEH